MEAAQQQEERSAGRRAAKWLLGALVVPLVVGLLTWLLTDHVFSSGPARFQGDLTSASGADAAQRFLQDHDGEVVYLSIRCDDYAKRLLKDVARDSHCSVAEIDNYSDDSPNAFKFWVFPTGGGPTDDYVRQMWINVPRKPLGSTLATSAGTRGDGRSGVGGLLVKGYFLALIGGTGSLGPPGLVVADLRPRSAP